MNDDDEEEILQEMNVDFNIRKKASMTNESFEEEEEIEADEEIDADEDKEKEMMTKAYIIQK